MSFGSVNTPGAWLVSVKRLLTELAARVSSTEKTLADLEKLTVADIGAVPTTRKVNNKPLSGDISLTAADVGAAAASHGTHVSYSTDAPKMDGTAAAGTAGTVARSDHVHPTDNSRAAANHTHTAADVGARPSTWMPTAADVGARPATWTPTASQVGARPATWTPTASQVGAKASGWTPFHTGTRAPSDKTQLWIDTTANTGGLKYWNGSAWVHVPVTPV